MRGRRQEQQGGDSSINLQASGNISVGLTYDETRQVVMDTFQANFVELRNDAFALVLERAEALLTSFLEEARKAGLTEIPEGGNPDFQYAVFDAQKAYARTGDEDLGELLVQLLVDRTKVQQRDLEQIVLNESLEVAAKLTPDQLDALALIFTVRYTFYSNVTNLPNLETYLVDSVLPFVEGASRKNSAYQHLEFAGCGAIGIGEVNAPLPFLRSYPGIWSTGFTEDEIIATGLKLTPEQHAQVFVSCLHDSSLLQVNAMTEDTIDSTVARLDLTEDQGAQLKQLHNSHLMQPNQVRDYLVNALPKMADYFEVWEGTAMKNMSLTSVGIAIAHANVKRITGEDSSLSLWM